MDIFSAIESLILYGIKKELIYHEDITFIRNKLFETLCIDDISPGEIQIIDDLEKILNIMIDYACENNLICDTYGERDLFDTKIMGIFVDRPSNVINKFKEYYKLSPEMATNYLYNLSRDSNYVRTFRISKDIRWNINTEYGDIEISINLSKPEKDPRDIAKGKTLKSNNYPKCPLCRENEGYKGGGEAQARQNLRIIPLVLNNKEYFIQYSPYSYYDEHSIVFNAEHKNMIVNDEMFKTLLDFVDKFPHYFIGANADIKIVGGSILSHDHFQSGRYVFPMERAENEKKFKIHGFDDVECNIVKWPMSVLRLKGKNKSSLSSACNLVYEKWKNYDDMDRFIISKSEGEFHNTVTSVVRRKGEFFECDLILRNNITTKEHPFGVYHPHEELHNIKKENIGLIEAMGLAILPGRLKNELRIVREYLISGKCEDEGIVDKHRNLIDKIIEKHNVNEENCDYLINNAIGEVFLEVLTHCGVFKRDEFGMNGFYKFIESLEK